ncbi:T9SS type A sorting domain-containing protein [Flavobacteriaceae bacterium]|jgi:hypothetical protein|nr:T9SS type A sorting domain-containing protein [Flavobacteriaceae bacterium]
MKKITLLLAFTLGFFSYAQFDWSTSPLESGWVEYAGANGEGSAQSWTYYAGELPFMYITWEASSGLESCEDWLVSPLVEITTTTSQLDFSVEDQFTDNYGSALSIQVSTTDQTSGFTEITSFTEVDISPSATLSADLSAYEGSSIYIAFVWINNNGDRLYLYDLGLSNKYASAPSPATTPNPADGATVDLTNDTDMNNDGSITAADQHYVFTWSPGITGDAPTAYDYYFGTDSSTLSLISETTANDGYRLYGLSTETTYFWQVVPKNAGGSADAANTPVWSFTTSSNVLSFNDNQLNSIVVSPNPVKDVVTINNLSGLDSVEVFNQLGQLVLKSNADLLNDNRLDLSTLNPGMYMLKIKAENKSKTVKIIKE